MRRAAAGLVVVLALLAALWAVWPRATEQAGIVPAEALSPANAPAGSRTGSGSSAPSRAADALPGDGKDTDAPVDLAALGAELEQDPDIYAICALELPVEDTTAHLVVGAMDDIPYDGRLLPVVHGRAFLPLLEGPGEGWLALDGYAPVPIRWSSPDPATGAKGTCEPNPVPVPTGTASVSGVVRNAAGEPEGKVFVEGCGNRAITDEEGAYAMVALPRPCAVQAFRRDGRLVASSDRVEVALEAGADRVVDLALPEIPQGGVGVKVEMGDDGVRVLEIIPGSSGEAAGLQAGDVVVEVEGAATTEMDLAQFVEEVVGDEGTELELVVRRGEERVPYTLERKVLR
jgi:hypothetical protein